MSVTLNLQATKTIASCSICGHAAVLEVTGNDSKTECPMGHIHYDYADDTQISDSWYQY